MTMGSTYGHLLPPDLPHFATTELALGSLPSVLAHTRPILAHTTVHATATRQSSTAQVHQLSHQIGTATARWDVLQVIAPSSVFDAPCSTQSC